MSKHICRYLNHAELGIIYTDFCKIYHIGASGVRGPGGPGARLGVSDVIRIGSQDLGLGLGTRHPTRIRVMTLL